MASKNPSNDGERLHLLMPPTTKRVLDRIQARTTARSWTEVIRRAIALYDVVSEEMAEDHDSIVVVRHPDGTETKVRIA